MVADKATGHPAPIGYDVVHVDSAVFQLTGAISGKPTDTSTAIDFVCRPGYRFNQCSIEASNHAAGLSTGFDFIRLTSHMADGEIILTLDEPK